MATSSSTSLIPNASDSAAGEDFSDPEVETNEYTAAAPYVWETWQTEILNHYLPFYKANKTVKQRTALLNKTFRRMQSKRDIPDSDVSGLRKAMRQWYGLKAKVRQPKQYKIRGVNWNFRTVAALLKKEEIKQAEVELAGGQPVKFGSYQAALNNVLGNMDEEELNGLKVTAAKWNAAGPPEEEKNWLSVKHAPKYAKAFAEKCFKQLGAWVLIYWGSMDTDGGLVSARFDFNNELGGGTAYKDMFNDAPVTDRTWGKYLERVYKMSEEQPILRLQPRGALMELDVDQDGEPIIPEEVTWPSDLTGEATIKWQKALLRSYLGAHYALATKDGTQRVPWTNVINAPKDFISAEYLPGYESIDREPSHLTVVKVRKLLRFWLARQSSGLVAFRWKLVMYAGEIVKAEPPKKGCKPSDDLTRKRGKQHTAKGRPKKKSKASVDFITSDDDLSPATTTRKKIKPRPIKKPRVVDEPDLDSGEDFDFNGVDLFAFSDDEQINQFGDRPLKENNTGGTSQEPDSLWMAFTNKLPEYKCWSPDRIQTEFQVFRGWAESSGLFQANGSTVGGGTAEQANDPATDDFRVAITDKPLVAGDKALTEDKQASSPNHHASAPNQLNAISSPSDERPSDERTKNIQKDAFASSLASTLSDATLWISSSIGAGGSSIADADIPRSTAPTDVVIQMNQTKTNDYTLPARNIDSSVGPMAKYSTPRLKDLFDSFRQLAAAGPSGDANVGPEVPKMIDVMRHTPQSVPLLRPAVIFERPATPSMMLPSAVVPSPGLLHIASDEGHPASAAHTTHRLAESPANTSLPVGGMGGMQTRKRKAEQEAPGTSKRVTKPPSKLPVEVAKTIEPKPTKGRKPSGGSGNPPKRGRGRPRKAGT
ncbi:uncharacterized protein LACBIDRAFT_298016 [Laccaria bicolor S238N-H82]|uniref:Predicted protein n=1 Tax=Laccaria bicolor (strain S238N-H82 / ATCC MYA-4686) TaxID=486041 RepID=B0DC29_LACBS|nr:uncharacterized protein LACBIDRAFT_298016 [Laccaria bicolor S238N-H82]EDR07662.1 predicted protein [Laccaria bicolor S238N-H82]|eukprot:XP_001881451.1 predicted protein [Laccaria bicolor S238N-H82]